MALTPVAAAAMSDNGATEDLLLPGEMSLSKDAIVKALAKPAVWGVGDKKRAVLLALVMNRDALLDRVGQSSQDQRATLEKWGCGVAGQVKTYFECFNQVSRSIFI
jgi:hypothetical protein